MRKLFLIGCMIFGMIAASISSIAQTVTANSEEIADNLDLNAVASLFGESKNIEDFENKLNCDTIGISNLDLNGDGEVDYLRCVEDVDGNDHYIVMQAVLAEDIYQDVATIYIKKNTEKKSITVQIIGNEYIYGRNYIVEPVYIYRPMIYSWFWDPYCRCWRSPYYWNYYPTYWRHYYYRPYHIYHHHIVTYHHHHHHCFYRHPERPHPNYGYNGHRDSHNGYGNSHPENSFNNRHPNYNNVSDHYRTINSGSTATKAPVNNSSRPSTNTSRVNTSSTSRPSSVTTSRPSNNVSRSSTTSSRSTSSSRTSSTTRK